MYFIYDGVIYGPVYFSISIIPGLIMIVAGSLLLSKYSKARRKSKNSWQNNN